MESMKIVDDNNLPIDATVSYVTESEIRGLVLESRGGAKGSKEQRNGKYLAGLNIILNRLRNKYKIRTIEIYLSSRPFMNRPLHERAVEVEGKTKINIDVGNIEELRKKISKAVSKMGNSTNGGNPTKRILISAGLDERKWIELITNSFEFDNSIDQNLFKPENIKDERKKQQTYINRRRGQDKFRKALLKAYMNKCAISGSVVIAVLQAAHIIPYQGEITNHIENGILLRSDIHDLFDLNLITIDENYRVTISESLKGSEYELYDGMVIFLPKNESEKPSKKALIIRNNSGSK